MLRKSTLLVAFAAALLLIGAGCDTIVTLTKPNVTTEAINTGSTLRLIWTAVTDAESYEIITDDSTHNTTSLSFDVEYPTSTIEVRAVNGNDKSDPATIDCKVVETASIVLYGNSDQSGNDPSGLAFASDGTASALSLDDANKASLDYVCDDVDITPVGFANAGDYGWSQNAKMNALADGGTDFDALIEAPASGTYNSQSVIAVNGVYALWMGATANWTTSDHFGKAKIISMEQPTGNYYKVTLKVAYQKIGGLRWLMN